MKYRALGESGLEVSLMCLGSMTWGRQNSEAEGHQQMDYALERGINFFDTAEIYAVPPNAETYGKTEAIIGSWFAARQNRERVILASKVAGPGPTWVRGGSPRIDRKNIFEAIEGSLRRLQSDYIDLYQLHWTNRPNYHFGKHWNFDPSGIDRERERDEFRDVLLALGELVEQGKVRHVGLSNDSAWGLMNWLDLAREGGLPRMVSIQNEYNLLNRHFDLDLAEVSLAESVGLLAWSPLATGMLLGKYLGGKRPEGSRWSIMKKNYRDTGPANRAVEAYLRVAAKHGLGVAQMAIAFVNSRPFVTSTIIGATSMEQLKTNIDSIDVELSEEVLADIDGVRRKYAVVY